jgi:hypothetical protein
MRDVVLTCSGQENKERMYELIEWMDGSFDVNLTVATTHVVCEDTSREKYKVKMFLLRL